VRHQSSIGAPPSGHCPRRHRPGPAVTRQTASRDRSQSAKSTIGVTTSTCVINSGGGSGMAGSTLDGCDRSELEHEVLDHLGLRLALGREQLGELVRVVGRRLARVVLRGCVCACACRRHRRVDSKGARPTWHERGRWRLGARVKVCAHHRERACVGGGWGWGVGGVVVLGRGLNPRGNSSRLVEWRLGTRNGILQEALLIWTFIRSPSSPGSSRPGAPPPWRPAPPGPWRRQRWPWERWPWERWGKGGQGQGSGLLSVTLGSLALSLGRRSNENDLYLKVNGQR
jgi:hypothetical protein